MLMVTCRHQTFLSKTFANLLNVQKQYKQNILQEWWRVLDVDKSTDHNKPHFDFFFTTMLTSKKMFFVSVSWKRHCASHWSHWREEHGMDSYQQWQINQSYCKIGSNCVHLNWLVKQVLHCTTVHNSTISLYICTVIWTVSAAVG